VIVDPPLLVGATHETATSESPDTPVTEVGAPGIVAGTTTLDGLDGLDVPALFVAVTVNV
jgi:hypothetical protein